jgi:hypothetical protein
LAELRQRREQSGRRRLSLGGEISLVLGDEAQLRLRFDHRCAGPKQFAGGERAGPEPRSLAGDERASDGRVGFGSDNDRRLRSRRIESVPKGVLRRSPAADDQVEFPLGHRAGDGEMLAQSDGGALQHGAEEMAGRGLEREAERDRAGVRLEDWVLGPLEPRQEDDSSAPRRRGRGEPLGLVVIDSADESAAPVPGSAERVRAPAQLNDPVAPERQRQERSWIPDRLDVAADEAACALREEDLARPADARRDGGCGDVGRRGEDPRPRGNPCLASGS